MATPVAQTLHQPAVELSFEERLKLLSKSAGALNVEHGQDSDRVCREVRGKE